MADFSVSQRVKKISSGNTNDNTISFGSFGQGNLLDITVHVVAGPIVFSLNEIAAGNGLSVAANGSFSFQIRADKDVIHFDQTANGDSFIIVVKDAK